MTIRPLFYAVLFAFGYLGSTEAQEAPIPQLSPGWARKPAPAVIHSSYALFSPDR